jgi:hypothetical protein
MHVPQQAIKAPRTSTRAREKWEDEAIKHRAFDASLVVYRAFVPVSTIVFPACHFYHLPAAQIGKQD